MVANGNPLARPVGLALSTDGRTLYIGSTGFVGTGSIVAMNVADRKLRTVAGGFVSPVSLAVALPPRPAVKVSIVGTGAVTPNG